MTEPDPNQNPEPARAGRTRRTSPFLLLTGLAAVAVSCATLFGPAHWDHGTANFHLAWVAVTVAVVLGLALIIAPTRR